MLHKIGALYHPEMSEFIVWAPLAKKVDLVVQAPKPGVHPMTADEHGYWKTSRKLPAGTMYRYRSDGQMPCPDPASLSQPNGVDGSSQLVDLAGFSWKDEAWQGLPLSNMVIYELHTGCFSPAHDFEGIIRRLDYLADLGINAIELMPLGQFAGERNWGYDGVYPFAVQSSYGGYEGFQRLVDEAHARGLAVLVDVVYNHFGPEGSCLEDFAPYLTDKYITPWGKAINFDDAWSDGVRNYFLQNASMWLEDFHVDGLRLDAAHAIKDLGAVHFIRELKDLAGEIERRTGRKKVLIAELDLNDPKYINPAGKNGYGLDGQWVDEFHHALRAYMTGERNAWLEDFGDLRHLEKAFTQTYVYNGVYSPHRKRTFGGHATHNPFSQFVVFAQNHDQVGNRAVGDRLGHQLSFEGLKLAAATVLLSPYVPLLFMGEEYGETNPFQFFVDFSDADLIEKVRSGRKKEFAGFIGGGEIPDPQSEETFLRSNLSWQYDSGNGAVLHAYYRHLIGMRKTRPAMQGVTRDCLHLFQASENILAFERKILNDSIFVWLHYGGTKISLPNNTGFTLRKIFDSAAREWLGPGSDGGAEISPDSDIILYPNSAVVFEKK
jgi:maltooligosyltrehalose trehalohydrolase